jgi:Zn-dependent protease/predicted transcriptional regulator
MRWSYRIGTVAGTDIKVHVTFLLLLGWYALDAYNTLGPAAAIGETLLILALFACVILHEFGHIFMARRFGVRTPDVILLPIGGVARLERIPEDPRQELLIAIAGPFVTLLIALALFLGLRIAGSPEPFLPTGGRSGSFAAQIMWVNVLLLGFNLIPAFPMDGGRVLRAVLATRIGLVRATRVAAAVGQVVAVGMCFYGLTRSPIQPLLLLIAFFVFVGAGTEASAVETRAAARGVQVSQMMVTQFRSIAIHATLAQAVDLLLAGEQREFPVVDNLGRTEGLLTRENLIRGLRERGPDSTVAEAMTSPAPTVLPSAPFQEGLDRLRASGLPALPVVDGAGALVGLLTMENISELLLVRRAVTR